jgi:glutathione reductase (NADPH)
MSHLYLRNHTMETPYDLIVIGTGIASVPARKCAAAGWKVAIIDEQPPGGTCALRGCTPKKMLRSGAEVMDLVERMNGKGVTKNDVGAHWRELQKHKEDYTAPIPANNEKNFEQAGIDFYLGKASFLDSNHLDVMKADGTTETLGFKKMVLATGARPSDLPFAGAELLLSSDDFLELPDLPQRIIFAGGGFISMEYAHIAARYGAKVQVIQRRELPLKTFDPDIVRQLVKVGAEHGGVDFLAHREIISIEKKGKVMICRVKNVQSDEEEVLEADAIFHGAGRVPNIDTLKLDRAGIQSTQHGIKVNKYMQSVSAHHVFAAGDCADTGAPQLSFSASREGVAVADNLLNGLQQEVSYKGQASVAFTLPPVAQAGLLESEAKEQGHEFDVIYHETARWFTNRRLNEGAGASKILVEKVTGKILGAHFLAHHCEEFINVFALAIHHGLTRADLKSVLWAHPTSASDLARLLG